MPFPWIPALIVAGATVVGVHNAKKANNKNAMLRKPSELEEYRKNIRKHWKTDFVFTDSWSRRKDARQLGADELLPGELSAVTYTVGCYTVRSSQRVYRIPENNMVYIPDDEIPADKEVPDDKDAMDYFGRALAKKQRLFAGVAVADAMDFFEGEKYRRKCRMANEITARHNADPAGEFKYICRAASATNRSWSERISCVCTIKKTASLPDEHACLFVCNAYMGNSYGTYRWYEFNPKGKLTHFRIHPLAEDDRENYW